MEFKTEDIMDLNEHNVQRLFVYCLANNTTPSENIIKRSFFENGEEINIPDMAFDQTKIYQVAKQICYMLGQLYSVHNGTSHMLAIDGFKKYDKTDWTKSKAAIFALYYLGVATETFPRFEYFSPLKNYASPLFDYCEFLKPTLSPNDPNFMNK